MSPPPIPVREQIREEHFRAVWAQQLDAVFADVSPKTKVLDKVLQKYKVKTDQICFVGDDLVDLCLMRKVGFPIAVFNACPEIKQAAKYITIRYGGRGAVREVAELILKSQGKWDGLVKSYDA